MALNDVDGSESITDITVSGVPAGAQLSAGTDNLDGTWTLTPAQLTGLTVTPPADSDADFTLTVSATSTEADGGTASQIASLTVTVTAVAGAPAVTVTDAVGGEDTAIPLDIGVALTNVDGSETITNITIAGVPAAATLSAGTDNLDGTWTLSPADLIGITLTPAPNSTVDFTLSVSATSAEAEGGTATTIANLDVTVTGGADQPVVTVQDAVGLEDTAIPLDITAELAGGGTGTQPQAMFVLDEGSDGVLKVGADGSVQMLVSEADITALTGKSGADLDDRGIAVNDAGDVFFTEKQSDSLFIEGPDGRQVIRSFHIPLRPDRDHPAGCLMILDDITDFVDQRERRERVMDQLVSTILKVVARQDPFTAEHAGRAAEVASAISNAMGLDDDATRTAATAAKLMNLGRASLPRELTAKPGKLEPGEIVTIRSAVRASAEMLQGVEFDGDVAETIHQVHERWDGEGEPRALKGDEILESARVVAVADAFTGMISARAHRPGLSLDKAEEIISSMAGASLDRKPVSALLFHLENGGGRDDWADFAVPPKAAE